MGEVDVEVEVAKRGSSSVGRASASQAEGRGFEPRLPLAVTQPSGVIGNTPDSGSGKSRFEPWGGNLKARFGEVGEWLKPTVC